MAHNASHRPWLYEPATQRRSRELSQLVSAMQQAGPLIQQGRPDLARRAVSTALDDGTREMEASREIRERMRNLFAEPAPEEEAEGGGFSIGGALKGIGSKGLDILDATTETSADVYGGILSNLRNPPESRLLDRLGAPDALREGARYLGPTAQAGSIGGGIAHLARLAQSTPARGIVPDVPETPESALGGTLENIRSGDFISRQAEDFQSRPLNEQLLGTLTDPTNLLGGAAVARGGARLAASNIPAIARIGQGTERAGTGLRRLEGAPEVGGAIAGGVAGGALGGEADDALGGAAIGALGGLGLRGAGRAFTRPAIREGAEQAAAPVGLLDRRGRGLTRAPLGEEARELRPTEQAVARYLSSGDPAEMTLSNRFITPLPDAEHTMARIGMSGEGIFSRAGRRIKTNSVLSIDPSAGANTVPKKTAIMAQRHFEAAESAITTAIEATLNYHAPSQGITRAALKGRLKPRPVGPDGWLFNTDDDGVLQGAEALAGRHYDEALEGGLRDPEVYARLSEKQQAVVDDMRTYLTELNDYRVALGMRPYEWEGLLYVTRQANASKGVDFLNNARPELGRVVEDVTEAVSEGVNYSLDLQERLRLMARSTYKQAIEIQTGDVLAQYAKSNKQLVKAETIRLVDEAEKAHKAAISDQHKVRQGAMSERRRLENEKNKTIRARDRKRTELARIEGDLRGRGEVARRLSPPELREAEIANMRSEVKAARQIINSVLKEERGMTRRQVRGEAQEAASATTRARERERSDFRKAANAIGRAERAYGRLREYQKTHNVRNTFAKKIEKADERIQLAKGALRRSGQMVTEGEVIEPLAEARRMTREIGAEPSRTVRSSREDTQLAIRLLREAENELGRLIGAEQVGRQARTQVARATRTPVSMGERMARLNREIADFDDEIVRLDDARKQQPMVRTMKGEAIDEASAAKVKETEEALKQARRQYSTEMKQKAASQRGLGQVFGYTDEQIPIERWRNKWLAREDAEFLEQALPSFGKRRDEVDPFTQGFKNVADTTRWLQATMDFSALFIQGLPTLALRPDVWARSAALHYRAWLQPSVQAKFLREHMPTIQRMIQEGVPIQDTEFFRAARRGGTFEDLGHAVDKIPVIGKATTSGVGNVSSQTFARFQASYDTFLTMNRVLLWEALAPAHADDLGGLARTIRNMTGGLSPTALGVGPNRRAWESLWMAFSPRLLRSTIALMGQAVQGVAPGASASNRMATQSMAQFLSAAGGIYIAAGVAAGKDWEEIEQGLNPLNGKKFMSYNVDGDWVGIGGQIRSVSQMIGAAAAEPSSMWALSRAENPLIRFTESRGAPGVAVAGGILDPTFGSDILRYEEFDGYHDAMWYAGSRLAPFWAQSVMERDGAIVTATEFMGGRASPGTPREQLDTIAQAKHGLPWADLERVQREEIEGLYPEVWAEYQAAGSDKGRRYAEVSDEVQAQQEAADTELLSGNMRRAEWRNLFDNNRTELFYRRAEIFGDDPIEDPQNPLEEYIKTIEDSVGATGEPDWEEVDAWLSRQSSEDRAYIERNTGIEATPVAQVFRELRRTRNEKFDIPEFTGYTADEGQLIKDLKDEVNARATSGQETPMLRAYSRMKSDGFFEGMDKKIVDGVYRSIRRGRDGSLLIRKNPERERFDKQHPELDLFFGSDATLTEAEIEQLQQLAGIS